MIIDIENLGESLRVSHYTEEGDLAYLDLKIPQSERYSWRKCSAADRSREKGWASWDGFPVKKQSTLKYDKYRQEHGHVKRLLKERRPAVQSQGQHL